MSDIKTVLIVTKQGKCIRIPERQFMIQMRGGQGVRAIVLHDNDEVATTTVVESEES